MRIEGVYDSKTLEFCQELSLPPPAAINAYSFDLRPRSLNFIQQRVLNQLFQDYYTSHVNYFLHFSREKDFVIKKIIDDLRKILQQEQNSGKSEENIYLEFSDEGVADFYDQFSTPYFWHYHPLANLNAILQGKYIRGIVLSYSLLEDLYRKDEFYNFLANFISSINTSAKKIQLILSLNWDQRPINELASSFSFKWISFPLSARVESSYRHVDFIKLENYLKQSHHLSI